MEGVMVTPPDRRAVRPQFPGPLQQQRQPASPALQQRAFAALMLALICLFGMVFLTDNLHRAVVGLAVTLVIGGTGLWLAISAMSKSRKAGAARPRFVILATVLAVLGTGMSALALTVVSVFWAPVNQYADCMSAASTPAAQSACNQQLHTALQNSVGLTSR
jgi:hypothetical protein